MIFRRLKERRKKRINARRLKLLQRIFDIPDPGFSEWQGTYIIEGEPYLYERYFGRADSNGHVLGRTTATMARVFFLADNHQIDIYLGSIGLDKHRPNVEDAYSVMHEDAYGSSRPKHWYNSFRVIYNIAKNDPEVAKEFKLENIVLHTR